MTRVIVYLREGNIIYMHAYTHTHTHTHTHLIYINLDGIDKLKTIKTHIYISNTFDTHTTNVSVQSDT